RSFERTALVGKRSDGVLVGDIEEKRSDRQALGFALRCQRIEGCRVAIRGNDVPAGSGEKQRGGKPDARTRTGDDDTARPHQTGLSSAMMTSSNVTPPGY